jgi:hypothetical protein
MVGVMIEVNVQHLDGYVDTLGSDAKYTRPWPPRPIRPMSL